MPALHVGQGTHVGALSVFPVWVEGAEVRGLATGAEAQVQVAEREGAPVVGELVLANAGPKPVLLLAGELFEGGWQHRALNQDVVVLPGSRMVAGVSCVEAGRWQGGTAQARRARRASVMVRAAQEISAGADRQGRVWERVSRYDAAFGASATHSYVDHLDRTAGLRAAAGSADPRGAVRRVRPLAGQRGVLVGLGGQPAFLEVFGSAEALRRHFQALLEAAAVDAALVPAVATPGRRARRLVERLRPVRLGVDPSRDAGAARALVASSPYHQVRAVGWEGRMAHATVFNGRHPLLVAT